MATQEKTLTTSFQLLAAGPLVVTLEQGKVAMLHIAASAPSPTAPAHRLVRGTDRESFTYNGADNVYAKITDPLGDRVVKVAYTG
jgi:hypothetical protein